MICGGTHKPALNTDWLMRLFKKFLKNYLFFGLGTIFGSVVATFVTYFICATTYGTPEMATLLDIQACLEEKINE